MKAVNVSEEDQLALIAFVEAKSPDSRLDIIVNNGDIWGFHITDDGIKIEAVAGLGVE